MAEVILENLRKTYAGRAVVDGIELQIDDGELLALVGPSGCGKTTTLRLIAGLEQPTAGEVRIAGRTVTQLPPKDRHVAMVFQHFTLYPHRNVFQNLAFGLRLRGAGRQQIETRVREAARMLGVEHLLHRRPHELSGGERQRIALGRCVAGAPRVLLLDEPLSNLDARWRETLQNDLVQLQQRLGTTTIHVTHDQQEAMMMGRRIAVMNAGRIEQIGSPREVYNVPANRFVAEFIGSPPMNFLIGQLQIEGNAATIACPAVRLRLPKERWPGLQACSGAQITLGIRPEDVRIIRPPGESWEPVRVEVLRSQPRGADSILRLRCGTHQWNSLISAAEPRPGEQLEVYLDTTKCHLFESDGGRVGTFGVCRP